MGDLGSDAGQSALSLGAKALEAILRLLERIFEAWRNNPERELTKMKLKNVKIDLERQKILDAINGKCGYVQYQELKKSGLELSPLGIEMTKEEMKEFSALCKREKVIFSGMTEKDHISIKNGTKFYEIICPTRDLEKIKGIVDRLNDEKMLAGIEQRISELQAKGDAMTEQDKVDVAALKEQRESIQRRYCDTLNNETIENIIGRTVNGEEGKKLTLDEALNRLTGRHIDKDVICVVADANDPSKYIKCHGYQDIYNDKAYIKTEYEVYRDAEMVFKTHDGRFDGRPEGYWDAQKAAIQQAGEFSGTYLKFYSVAEHQKWAEATREQNSQELSPMEYGGDRDYAVIIKELEMQLEDREGKMLNGEVYSFENVAVGSDGKAVGVQKIVITDNMTAVEKTNAAELLLIGKQINNYRVLSQVEQELTLANTNVLLANEGTEERVAAEAELARIQNKFDKAVETEKQLLVERKEINAVQAEQEMRNRVEKVQDVGDKDHVNARSDRADNRDDRAVSMEESKEVIKEKRAEQKVKLGKEKVKVEQSHIDYVKPKSSMSHGDR